MDNEQDKLKRALATAMADQSNGSYSMFERSSFQKFFKLSCSYAKNYREIPTFLNFERRSLKLLVSSQSSKLMGHFKIALNQALRKQAETLRSGDTPAKRITVTLFMDHVIIRHWKKKIGMISSMIRITDRDGKSCFISMPISIFDAQEQVRVTDLNGDMVTSSGATALSNAKHYSDALKELFDEDNRQFCGGTFDGAIYDRRKTVFVDQLKQN